MVFKGLFSMTLADFMIVLNATNHGQSIIAGSLSLENFPYFFLNQSTEAGQLFSENTYIYSNLVNCYGIFLINVFTAQRFLTSPLLIGQFLQYTIMKMPHVP